MSNAKPIFHQEDLHKRQNGREINTEEKKYSLGIINFFMLEYADNGVLREFLREVRKMEYPETLVVGVRLNKILHLGHNLNADEIYNFCILSI